MTFNSGSELIDKDIQWVDRLVSTPLNWICFLMVAAFIGHRSFGSPDFGITLWHLFVLAFGGAFALWIGTTVVAVRAEKRMVAEMQQDGFTEEEIAEVMRKS